MVVSYEERKMQRRYQMRQLRGQRFLAGMCKDCGKRPRQKNRTTCRPCAFAVTERAKKAYKLKKEKP